MRQAARRRFIELPALKWVAAQVVIEAESAAINLADFGRHEEFYESYS